MFGNVRISLDPGLQFSRTQSLLSFLSVASKRGFSSIYYWGMEKLTFPCIKDVFMDEGRFQTYHKCCIIFMYLNSIGRCSPTKSSSWGSLRFISIIRRRANENMGVQKSNSNRRPIWTISMVRFDSIRFFLSIGLVTAFLFLFFF